MEKVRREYPDIAPSGPINVRAVRAGNMLFISGCTARGSDAEGGPPVEQLRVTLDKITRIVAAEGGQPEDIVQMTTFVTNIADWHPWTPELIAVWEEYFRGQPPANALIGIKELLPGLDIEIDSIAIIG